MTKPDDLGPAGTALWDALTADAEFDSHEAILLGEACRVQDRLKDLDRVVRDEGVTIATPQGVRAHPALVEARQQGLELARLIASLRIPDDDGARPQSRGGARGTYRRA